MNTKPVPRSAVGDDVPLIEALVSEAYGVYIPRTGRKPKPMLADYHHALANHQVWVIERELRVVAVLELVPEDNHLLIENVAVDPAFQRTGLGRQLMVFAEAEAVRQHLGEVRLYTNELFTENRALYIGLGFHETHREPVNGGIAVHMAKQMA